MLQSSPYEQDQGISELPPFPEVVRPWVLLQSAQEVSMAALAVGGALTQQIAYAHTEPAELEVEEQAAAIGWLVTRPWMLTLPIRGMASRPEPVRTMQLMPLKKVSAGHCICTVRWRQAAAACKSIGETSSRCVLALAMLGTGQTRPPWHHSS